MADKFKLDDNGHCPCCNKLSLESEHVQCYSCKRLVHAICNAAVGDERIATKTMVNSFLLPSTIKKGNFLFFCDYCKTELEVRGSQSDGQRLNMLETRMNTFDGKFNQIITMLKTQVEKEVPPVNVPQPAASKSPPPKPRNNIWFDDPDKLASVKAPPPTAALVIPKSADQRVNIENRKVVEKAIVDNNITLKESITKKSGDLVLVMNSCEERDNLKNLVQTAKEDIKMNSPKPKHQSITIVGLAREYSKEEIMKLILQNELVRRFSVANKLDEHFKIHVVKPLKNNPERYQIYASVSQILRDGIHRLGEKLLMGVNSCKVYDRSQTKRCNKCQMFGHYMASCPAVEPSCGKCSGNHQTNDCTSEARDCINCKRNNIERTTPHSAFYHKCPAMHKYQDLKQQYQLVDDLNMQRQNRIPTT